MAKRTLQFRPDLFLLIIFLSASSFLLIFSGGGFILNLKTLGFSVTSQTEKAAFSVYSFITETVSSVKELSELKEKYAQISERLKDYELLQHSSADIQRENRELKELLGFSEKIRTKNIAAEIIGLDPDNLYSGVIINRGVKHGVRKNMPVIAFQNGNMAFAGKIATVGYSSSIIIPVYDDRCFVAAKMEISKHKGIVNGQGSNDRQLVMRYVKKKAKDDIGVGDKVVTSGLDDSSMFPKNIPIGFVSKIRIHDYETSLEIFLEPIIDFSTLEYVFVLDSSEIKKEF